MNEAQRYGKIFLYGTAPRLAQEKLKSIYSSEFIDDSKGLALVQVGATQGFVSKKVAEAEKKASKSMFSVLVDSFDC